MPDRPTLGGLQTTQSFYPCFRSIPASQPVSHQSLTKSAYSRQYKLQCNCYLYWEASVWASLTKPSILVSALKQFRFIFCLPSGNTIESHVFDNDAYVFSFFFRKYSTKGGLSRDRSAPNPLDNIMHFVLKVSVEKGYSVTYNPLNWAEGSSALNNTIVLSLWNSCGFFLWP